MANFFHLEGQNFAFNIDRVDYFIKSQEEPTESELAKYLITFYSNEIKVGIWVYDSVEARDNQFVSLVTKKFPKSSLKDQNIMKVPISILE
ncbi:hypothetical protein L0657_25465 [Dyadobacter sp. CY345]|uniref:hypothetical protein n=1 Tax=Dyadobacter sp. CY345 TaxID=2909335 RepID=UPI001F187D2F|nr:hypothetical protein [Dyadobacter sp. CY345]MCF2447328.1 hypothetical protein [Dyadobacter sp. CY345]